MSTLTITLAHVHDVLDDDGPAAGERRVLVDRLWPRGIKKERLVHDEWDKDVAPSDELRKAFHGGHIPFEEFSTRYRRELAAGDAPQQLLDRAKEAGAKTIVLLFATKDVDHNQAPVLKDVLEELQG